LLSSSIEERELGGGRESAGQGWLSSLIGSNVGAGGHGSEDGIDEIDIHSPVEAQESSMRAEEKSMLNEDCSITLTFDINFDIVDL